MGGHNFPNLKLKPHWAACVTLTQSTQTSLSCMLNTQTSFFWEPWHSNLTELHSNLFFLEPWHSRTVTLKPSHACVIWPLACAHLTTCMRECSAGRQSPLWWATGPALSPLGWATGPCRPLVGRQDPLFFFCQEPRCKFEEKKLHLRPVTPHRGAGG